jgi:hypothetical protein
LEIDPQPLHSVLTTNEVFMLITAILFGCCSYILDYVYKKNKILFWATIFFPPLLLYDSFKYRESLRGGLVYIGVSIIFTFFLALLTRIEYFTYLLHLISIACLWPYHLAIYIHQIWPHILYSLKP